MRAFKTQQDFKELESELIDAQNGDVEMVVQIPKGSTRARAMNIIHWEAAKKIKKIDHEALLEKRKNLKAGTSRDCIKSAIISKVNEMMKATAAEKAKEWGLEEPQLKTINQNVMEARIEDLYKKALEKAKSDF